MKTDEECMQDFNFGVKIQEYRNMKGISLRELASRTGVTASMLSQIENNNVNPSINTLRQIAEALDFPLYALFQENTSMEDELIVRKGNYHVIGKEGEEVDYRLLTPNTRGMIEFVLMTIPPQTVSSDKEYSHKGEETAYIIEGCVSVYINGKSYQLHSGDAVRIPPQTRHKWFNQSDKKVEVIFAVSPPSF
ncbi:cupin domain-containing protein [Treponema socranskii]|uniref:cupin domain-containing protein n=1 Tax=Treponema socranskii TaxID=53419 RepID=UPI0028EB381B|nr:cupin domain-containing protein [Treponema socranskii]